MRRGTWAATLVVLWLAQSATSACGGSSSGGGGSGGDLAASSSSSPASSSSSTSSLGAECAMKPDKQTCFGCCETDLPKENAVLIDDLIGACACGMPPDGGTLPCATDPACMPECATKVFDQACLDCVNSKAIGIKPQDPCVKVGYQSCQNDPKCSPVLDCSTTYCTQPK